MKKIHYLDSLNNPLCMTVATGKRYETTRETSEITCAKCLRLFKRDQRGCDNCGENKATHERSGYDVCPTDRGDEMRWTTEWVCDECDPQREVA